MMFQRKEPMYLLKGGPQQNASLISSELLIFFLCKWQSNRNEIAILLVGRRDYGDISSSYYRWCLFFPKVPTTPRYIIFRQRGFVVGVSSWSQPPLPSLCVWSLKEWFNGKMTCLVSTFKQNTWGNARKRNFSLGLKMHTCTLKNICNRKCSFVLSFLSPYSTCGDFLWAAFQKIPWVGCHPVQR